MKAGKSPGPTRPDSGVDGAPLLEGDTPDRPNGWVGSLTLVLAPFVAFALLLALDGLLR
jgi:hypothetical protein